MPKKFAAESSKAAAARARKEVAKEEQTQKKVKAEEDAQWADDDKLVARKLARKDDKEKKRLEQLQKKAEAKALLDAEVEVHSSPGGAKSTQAKLTRAQIIEQQERERAAAAAEAEKQQPKTHLEEDLVENVNRLQIEGEAARNIDEAITVLSGKDDAGDRHPEKRQKIAYAEFETRRLPQVKAEHPNMRLSQLKQLLHKEWLKSPENPMNQKILQYNAKLK